MSSPASQTRHDVTSTSMQEQIDRLTEEVRRLREDQTRLLTMTSGLRLLPSLSERTDKILQILSSTSRNISSSHVEPPTTNTLDSTRSNVSTIDDTPSRTDTGTAPLSGVVRSQGDMRIWVGTWNVGAKDPFEKINISQQTGAVHAALSSFVPRDCDLYVLGIQEGINDSVYEAMRTYTGCFQLPLMCRLFSAREQTSGGVRSRRLGHAINVQSILDDYNQGKIAESVATQSDMLDRVWGRGDGAFLHPKFTGIAVFVQPVVAPYVRLIGVYKHAFGASEGSKGGAAVALGIYDTTIAFVNVHMASKRTDLRRQQYIDLVDRFGAKLGGRGYGLNESFHHVVWCGDMNYHCTGIRSSDALRLIGQGNHLTLLHRHDELLKERESDGAFHGYHEPIMAPDFVPTYKKLSGRNIVDYNNPNWPSSVYLTQFKEPFYKGGRVSERIPSWTDRIMYHSLSDRLGELAPELLNPMDPDNSPHVYHAVNDGMDISDHSPVYTVFKLNVSIDYLDDAYGKLARAQIGMGMRPDWVPDDLRAFDIIPAGTHALMNGFGINGPLLTGPGSESIPRALRPVDVILRVTDVRVDYRGQMRTPRAVIILFPLPFEDSDALPERAKVVRAGTMFSMNARSETTEKISGTIRHTVSRASRLGQLHLLLKVSLDDDTKAQCTVSMRDGGFTVAKSEHSHTFFVPLMSQGSLLRTKSGRPVNCQFILHSTIHSTSLASLDTKTSQYHGAGGSSYREDSSHASRLRSASSHAPGSVVSDVRGRYYETNDYESPISSSRRLGGTAHQYGTEYGLTSDQSDESVNVASEDDEGQI